MRKNLLGDQMFLQTRVEGEEWKEFCVIREEWKVPTWAKGGLHQKRLGTTKLNEGLYFRSPRLATRFESNAANIARVRVKALLNLVIKFNIQEIQVVKNSQVHISSVFSLKIYRQNIKNPLR